MCACEYLTCKERTLYMFFTRKERTLCMFFTRKERTLCMFFTRKERTLCMFFTRKERTSDKERTHLRLCGLKGRRGGVGKCALQEGGGGVDPEARDSGAEKYEGGCLSYSPIYFYIDPSIFNAKV